MAGKKKKQLVCCQFVLRSYFSSLHYYMMFQSLTCTTKKWAGPVFVGVIKKLWGVPSLFMSLQIWLNFWYSAFFIPSLYLHRIPYDSAHIQLIVKLKHNYCSSIVLSSYSIHYVSRTFPWLDRAWTTHFQQNDACVQINWGHDLCKCIVSLIGLAAICPGFNSECCYLLSHLLTCTS